MTDKVNYRTWVIGETVTAAQLNEQIRDNGNASWPFTTEGDIAVASGANSLARLAKGNNYGILSVLAGAIGYNPLSNLIQFQASNAISTDTNSTSWIDVPNSTINLTLNATSQLFIWLVGSVSGATGAGMTLRLAAGTNYSSEALELYNGDTPRQTVQFHHVASYPAGDVTIKAQYKAGNSTQIYLYNAHVWVLAIPK